MVRSVRLFSLMVACFLSPSIGAEIAVEVRAESALLVNADSGAILFEKNSRQVRHPASITKIATALFALEQRGNHLSFPVKASKESLIWLSQAKKIQAGYKLPGWWLEPGATHIGLQAQEELTLEQLLAATLIASANDAANVVAMHIGGTISRFMNDLNAYLLQLGCGDTHFENPHGLHHPNHVTTAYDMALIARHALRSQRFIDFVRSTSWERPKTSKHPGGAIPQGNRLLRKSSPFYYEKAFGMKTGYTAAAKHTLVAAATHEGRTLIAVLLGAPERRHIFEDAKHLFEAAFSERKKQATIIPPGRQQHPLLVQGRAVPVYTDSGFSLSYYPSEMPQVTCERVTTLSALPITRGAEVGLFRVYLNGEIAVECPLRAAEAVSAPWWWKRLFDYFFS